MFIIKQFNKTIMKGTRTITKCKQSSNNRRTLGPKSKFKFKVQIKILSIPLVIQIIQVLITINNYNFKIIGVLLLEMCQNDQELLVVRVEHVQLLLQATRKCSILRIRMFIWAAMKTLILLGQIVVRGKCRKVQGREEKIVQFIAKSIFKCRKWISSVHNLKLECIKIISMDRVSLSPTTKRMPATSSLNLCILILRNKALLRITLKEGKEAKV